MDVKKRIKREKDKKKAIELEEFFNQNRIFGDERDFDFFNHDGHESELMCVIYKKLPELYPEEALDEDNLITVCSSCVRKAITRFKELS